MGLDRKGDTRSRVLVWAPASALDGRVVWRAVKDMKFGVVRL